MREIQVIAPIIIKKTREDYGYTQREVAEWIGTSRTNYVRKEKTKNGVALTADEFLTIMREFQTRGPKNKNNKDIQELLNILIHK